MPIRRALRLGAEDGSVRIDRLSLQIAGSDVKGKISLASAGARRRIEARLDLDELTVGRLLAPLLDQRLAVAGLAEAALSGRQNPWPDEPFDTAVLEGFEGIIKLEAPSLALTEACASTRRSSRSSWRRERWR